jgi:hypothetical protein
MTAKLTTLAKAIRENPFFVAIVSFAFIVMSRES